MCASAATVIRILLVLLVSDALLFSGLIVVPMIVGEDISYLGLLTVIIAGAAVIWLSFLVFGLVTCSIVSFKPEMN